MSLIKWDSDVEVVYEDKDAEQEALLLMLTRDFSSIECWTGEVKQKKVVGQSKVTRVLVRKNLQGTSVLIDIGIKDQHRYVKNPFATRADPDSIISISANGKMNYTLDEITELNLVIKEAVGVYKNLIAKEEEETS